MTENRWPRLRAWLDANDRKFPVPATGQAAMDARKPEEFQRWFNYNTERIERAIAKGYSFVLDDSGNPVKRVTGSDGSEQVLMTTAKIERNLKRRSGFAMFMARRSPDIAARIIKFNQAIDEGARIRGWHPGHTAKRFCAERGCISFNEFHKTFRPERWRGLPPTAFIKHGKRKYLKWNAFVDLRPLSGTTPTHVITDDVQS